MLASTSRAIYYIQRKGPYFPQETTRPHPRTKVLRSVKSGLVALGRILDASAGAARLGNYRTVSYALAYVCKRERERRLTGCSRLILAINGIASDIEEVPDLIQGTAITADVGLRATVQLTQGGLDSAQGVGLGAGGGDSCRREGLSILVNPLLVCKRRYK